MPITSDLRSDISLRIDVAPSPENGLRLASQVLVDQPQTVRFDEIGQVIGHLDVATMRSITRQIAVVLGSGAAVGRSGRITRQRTR